MYLFLCGKIVIFWNTITVWSLCLPIEITLYYVDYVLLKVLLITYGEEKTKAPIGRLKTRHNDPMWSRLSEKAASLKFSLLWVNESENVAEWNCAAYLHGLSWFQKSSIGNKTSARAVDHICERYICMDVPNTTKKWHLAINWRSKSVHFDTPRRSWVKNTISIDLV